MNQWANTVLTEKGASLLAKLTQGNTLNITRAITGSGFITPGLLTKQTEVTTPQQDLTFRSASYPEEGKCKLSVDLTNVGLVYGYIATQVGIYATDPDEGEVLFIITQAQDEQRGTIIPSETEMPGYSSEWTFYFQYGQADGVNITIDPTNTVSREEMENFVREKMADMTTVYSQSEEPENAEEGSVWVDHDEGEEEGGETAPEDTTLPIVTDEDNGKVLAVSGGEWAARKLKPADIGAAPADNYATEAFVSNKIAEAQLGGDDSEIDLSGYATKDDVHQLSIEKAPMEHVHTAEQVGARPDTWMPTASDVGAAPASHVSNKSNPHGVTAEQVGARPNTWMPTASDVGAAPASHVSNKSNPHGVTRDQLGMDTTLWNGSWTSGSITVPDTSKYRMFMITMSGQGTCIPVFRMEGHVRGIGGYVNGDDKATTYQFSATIDGNKWTWAGCNSGTIGGTSLTNRTVTKIWGLL